MRDGRRFKVVNRDTTLTLPEMNVRYLGYTTQKTISSDVGTESASGTFVIVHLRVTNKTDSPVSFNADEVMLSVTPGKTTTGYSHIFDAENMPGDSFVWNDEAIQPGTSKTGSVVFDMPPKRIAELRRSGNVHVVQFSDGDFEQVPQHTLGQIRTYA